MKPVLVIGDIAAEVHLRGMSGHPKRGREVFLSHASVQPGGAAARLAAQLSQLGVKTALLGRVGKDEIGDLVLRGLKGRVSLSAVTRDPKLRTGMMLSLSDDEDASVMTFPGATAAIGLDSVDFRRYSHVHVCSPFQLLGLPMGDVIRKARRAEATVSAGCGADPRGRGLGAVDLDVLLTDDPKAGRAMVTVLKKRAGAVAFTENKRWTVSGDVRRPEFDAVFLRGWLRGDRVQDTLAAAVGRNP